MLISRVSAALAPMLVLTLVAAGFVFLPPAPQTAAAADASLTLSASSSAVHPGDSFSVSVDLTMPAGAHALSTVAFRVTFDASLMTVQDAAPSGSFPSVMEKATIASFVGLSLSVGSDNSHAVATSTNVATIHFQAKAVADTKASLHIRDASAFSIAAADSPAANIIGGSSGTSVCIAADLDCSPPQLVLSKEKSKYNGWVVATMTHFTPNSPITVAWPGGAVLFTTTADGAGNASGRFRTPLYPLGNYTVTATDGSDNSAHDTLRVIPRIMLAPESFGPTGYRFRVYLYGFSPGVRVQIQWYTSSTRYTVLETVTIADNGRGSIIVYVPDDASTGNHLIRGKVIGVSRSASTTFRVTGPGVAAEPTTTATPSPTPTATGTPEPTLVPSPTETPTVEATPEPTGEASPEPAPTDTPTVAASPTETATPEPTPTDTPIPTEAPILGTPDAAAILKERFA